jgi:hypothetical protein
MLILPIKTYWLNKIVSHEKDEEYREFKPYWTIRFKKVFDFYENGMPTGKDIKKVMLRAGYSESCRSIIVEASLRIGMGKPELGAPNKECYILKVHSVEIFHE